VQQPRATSATATAARIEIEVRLGSKLGHGDDVRCMTALPPKAEVKGDLAMSPKCHNRTRVVQ
jgi:hypothetical protein